MYRLTDIEFGFDIFRIEYGVVPTEGRHDVFRFDTPLFSIDVAHQFIETSSAVQGRSAADEFVAEDAYTPQEPLNAAPEDPFYDAESIERRMLGEEDGFGDVNTAAQPAADPGARPFGARLADANQNAGYDDEFDGYEPAAPLRPAPRAGAAR